MNENTTTTKLNKHKTLSWSEWFVRTSRFAVDDKSGKHKIETFYKLSTLEKGKQK